MEEQQTPRNNSRNTKLYSVIVTVLLFLFFHTGGLLWFLSGMNSTVNFQSQQISEVKTILNNFLNTNYSKEDASKDLKHIDSQIIDMKAKIIWLEEQFRANTLASQP